MLPLTSATYVRPGQPRLVVGAVATTRTDTETTCKAKPVGSSDQQVGFVQAIFNNPLKRLLGGMCDIESTNSPEYQIFPRAVL